MSDWKRYYEVNKHRPPRKLLVEALKSVKETVKALDLGAGSLNESRYLLEAGFAVTAVDSEPQMIELAQDVDSPLFYPILESFDTFDFPKEEYDIVCALYSLPFTQPKSFEKIFSEMKNSLKPGGIFCGEFFGKNDSWNNSELDMTFHTKQDIENLLHGMNIILLDEEENDKPTAANIPKHWHVFHVIAQKKSLSVV